MLNRDRLVVSGSIPATTDVAEIYKPALGEDLYIVKFNGQAAFSTNAVVMLIWDYEGAGEEIIWSTKGSQESVVEFGPYAGDGVKELALVCSNGEAAPLILSGMAELRIVSNG